MRHKSEKPKDIGFSKKTESVSHSVDGGGTSASCSDENNSPKASSELSYMPEFGGMAKKIYALGGTDADLAEALNVSVETIEKWRKEQKDFTQACKQGAAQANSEVQRSVFKMATGHEYVVEEVRFYQGRAHTLKHRKYVPPDLRAAKVWLLNRYAKKWSDNPQPEQEKSDLAILLEQINGSRVRPKNADGTIHDPSVSSTDR